MISFFLATVVAGPLHHGDGEPFHVLTMDATPKCGHRRLVAFTHIPKTGGTSVDNALFSCEGVESWLLEAAYGAPLRYHLPVKHYIAALAAREKVPLATAAELWHSDVFSFAITRNPYEWHVSIFFYGGDKCASLYLNGDAGSSCELFGEDPAHWYEWRFNDTLAIAHYADWVEKMDARYPANSSQSMLFAWTVTTDVDKVRSDPSQVAYLTDYDENIAITRRLDIGDLDEAFPDLSAECLAPRCPDSAMPFEHDNEGYTHVSAAAIYASERSAATAAIVERRLARDFDELGYRRGVYSSH